MLSKVKHDWLLVGLFTLFFLKGPIPEWPLVVSHNGRLFNALIHAICRSLFTLFFIEEVKQCFTGFKRFVGPSRTLQMLTEVFLFSCWTHLFGYIMWTVVVVCLTEVPNSYKYLITALGLSFFSSVLLYAYYDVDNRRLRTRSDARFVWIFDAALHRSILRVKDIARFCQQTGIPVQKPFHRRMEELRRSFSGGPVSSFRRFYSTAEVSPLVRNSSELLATQFVEQWDNRKGRVGSLRKPNTPRTESAPLPSRTRSGRIFKP